jgi:hypothetical protein
MRGRTLVSLTLQHVIIDWNAHRRTQFCRLSHRIAHSASSILPTSISRPTRSGQASAGYSCATKFATRSAASSTSRSIYAGLAPGALPANLHLILEPEGRSIDFPNLAARVWGRALVEHTPDYRPMSGVPEPADGLWNIALAHGFFMEEGEIERSSPITPADIERSRYDYVALGHVHVLSDVSQGATRAFYCGTPAPLYSSENSGWVLWVNCVPGQPLLIERLMVG